MIVQAQKQPKRTKQRRCILLEPLRELRYDKAIAEYGQTALIFEQGQPRPSVFDSKRFCEAIAESLERLQFDPEVDYIVMSGSTNALVQLSATVAAMGPFTALLYCTGRGGYLEIHID